MKKLLIAMSLMLMFSVSSFANSNVFSWFDGCGVFPYEEISGQVLDGNKGISNVLVTSLSAGGNPQFTTYSGGVWGYYSVGACADGSTYVIQGYHSRLGYTSATVAVSGESGINLYY